MYVRPQTQPSHEEKWYGELLGLTHTFATVTKHFKLNRSKKVHVRILE